MGARTYPFDASLQLADGLTAISAAGIAPVAGQPGRVDLYGQRTEAWVIVNVASMKVSAGDEAYRLTVEGSNDPAFASGVKPLVSFDLGAGGNASPSSYEFGLCSEQGDSVVRYVRMRVTPSGTAPSITFRAFLARQPG